MTSAPQTPRFAPLSGAPSPAPQLAGIVFDVDGTLCAPQTWMFSKMRSALGIEPGIDILTHVAGLEDPRKGMELVEAVEREAMACMVG